MIGIFVGIHPQAHECTIVCAACHFSRSPQSAVVCPPPDTERRVDAGGSCFTPCFVRALSEGGVGRFYSPSNHGRVCLKHHLHLKIVIDSSRPAYISVEPDTLALSTRGHGRALSKGINGWQGSVRQLLVETPEQLVGLFFWSFLLVCGEGVFVLYVCVCECVCV